MPSRLLHVDDSPVVRRSLRTHIEAQTDWELCGEAENGKRAVEMAQTLSPDVIVLDLDARIRTTRGKGSESRS